MNLMVPKKVELSLVLEGPVTIVLKHGSLIFG